MSTELACEILKSFRYHKTRSLPELAEEMELSQSNLKHHVEILLAHGLVLEGPPKRTRPSGRAARTFHLNLDWFNYCKEVK